MVSGTGTGLEERWRVPRRRWIEASKAQNWTMERKVVYSEMRGYEVPRHSNSIYQRTCAHWKLLCKSASFFKV